MTQHTHGPWIALTGLDDDPQRWGVYVDGAMHYHIATIENGAPGDTLDTESSNARLIAAAPELLEALRDCVTSHECAGIRMKDPDKLIRRLEAINDRVNEAIDKAEG